MSDLGTLETPAEWDDLWRASKTPWDTGTAHPFLARLVQDLPSGRVLIPGCGAAHEAAVFAAARDEADPAQPKFSEIVCLDISQEATKQARAKLAAAALPADDVRRIQFQQGDFFVHGATFGDGQPVPTWHAAQEAGVMFTAMEPANRYDVIFDYTFLTCIRYADHAAWADTHRRLLKPNGVLVCVIFPVRGQVDDSPPYAQHPMHVRNILCEDTGVYSTTGTIAAMAQGGEAVPIQNVCRQTTKFEVTTLRPLVGADDASDGQAESIKPRAGFEWLGLFTPRPTVPSPP